MNRALLTLAFPALLGLIYGKLVWLDPLLARDDLKVLSRIKSMSDIKVATEGMRFDLLLAYTPIRDLTFHLDQWMSSTLGFGTFHLTNLLLWIGVLFLANIILKRAVVDSTVSSRRTLLLIIATHPVFVGTVAWVSARKHLLSGFFILAATCALTTQRRITWKTSVAILVLYLCSLFSHPIHVLWPLWALAYCLTLGPKDRWKALVPCAPILIGGVAGNLFFYLTQYPTHTTASKFVSEFDPGISFLAHGRYLANLVLPIRLAPAYYPGSALGILGLIVGLGILLKALRSKSRAVWLGFYLYPLIPVTLWMTHVFVSDTYVAVAWLGLAVLILPFVRLHPRAWASLILVTTSFSVARAGTWLSDQALWSHALVVEPSPRTIGINARMKLDQKQLEEARSLIEQLRKWDPMDPELPYLDARATYLDPSRSIESKIESIQVLSGTDIWVLYFKAALLAEKGEFAQSYDLLRNPILERSREFGPEVAVVAAEAAYFCDKAKGADCDSIRGLARKRNPIDWSENAYQLRSAELRVSNATH